MAISVCISGRPERLPALMLMGRVRSKYLTIDEERAMKNVVFEIMVSNSVAEAWYE
jgi:hypothetical protein